MQGLANLLFMFTHPIVKVNYLMLLLLDCLDTENKFPEKGCQILNQTINASIDRK